MNFADFTQGDERKDDIMQGGGDIAVEGVDNGEGEIQWGQERSGAGVVIVAEVDDTELAEYMIGYDDINKKIIRISEDGKGVITEF